MSSFLRRAALLFNIWAVELSAEIKYVLSSTKKTFHLSGRHQCCHVPSNNVIQATSRVSTWDLFLINCSGVRRPISIHFINLFVPCFRSPNGRDYSNLAQSTSTSHAVTPFCHVWPLWQHHHITSQNKHPLVHLHRTVYPSRLPRTLPIVDIYCVLWLKMQATSRSSRCLPASDQRELWGVMGWSSFGTYEILWKLVVYGMASWVFSRGLADLLAAGLWAIRAAAVSVVLLPRGKDPFNIMTAEIAGAILLQVDIEAFSLLIKSIVRTFLCSRSTK